MNAKKIKARMIIMGLTQKNIAEVWGCATATVSQKLTGYRPISLNEANLLAEKLNLTDKEYYEFFLPQILRSAIKERKKRGYKNNYGNQF